MTYISEDVLKRKGNFRTLHEQCDWIEQTLAEGGKADIPPRVYVVIHNIDGAALRAPHAQEAFSMLAAIPQIHLIASVDHVNAPLRECLLCARVGGVSRCPRGTTRVLPAALSLQVITTQPPAPTHTHTPTVWNSAQAARFNWVWIELHTYAPYKVESAGDSGDGTEATTAQGSLYVLRSLTSNARAMFVKLARAQLSRSGDPGLTFHEYYAACREDFLVNSDLTMRTQVSNCARAPGRGGGVLIHAYLPTAHTFWVFGWR